MQETHLSITPKADDIILLQRHRSIATHLGVVDEDARLGVEILENEAVLFSPLDDCMSALNGRCLGTV